jgi:hypothetical protein
MDDNKEKRKRDKIQYHLETAAEIEAIIEELWGEAYGLVYNDEGWGAAREGDTDYDTFTTLDELHAFLSGYQRRLAEEKSGAV